MGGSLQALAMAAKETANSGSKTLQAATRQHARGLGLRIVEWSPRWGLVVGVADLRRCEPDPRTQAALATSARADSPGFVEQIGTTACRPATAAGLHALRVIARVRAASSILSTRNDAEGREEIDIEA